MGRLGSLEEACPRPERATVRTADVLTEDVLTAATPELITCVAMFKLFLI